MDVLEAIRKRRSVRRFREFEVERETIEKLIEYACMAPSSGNVQNWEFFIVRDKEKKKKVAEAAHGQRFVENASFLVVVCSNDKAVEERYGERGKRLYSIQNTAASIENLMLACLEFGLGTCWVGAFDEEALKKELCLPDNLSVHAIIAVGKPAESPEMPRRLKKIHFI